MEEEDNFKSFLFRFLKRKVGILIQSQEKQKKKRNEEGQTTKRITSKGMEGRWRGGRSSDPLAGWCCLEARHSNGWKNQW
jgi:hypothetical protein